MSKNSTYKKYSTRSVAFCSFPPSTPIFTTVAQLNLEHHLPIIGDFWETLLFGTGSYQKHGRNPLQIHRALHLKSPLEFGHFNRWLEIFNETVDETFAGTRADFIKLRANAIANRMLNFVGSVPAELF